MSARHRFQSFLYHTSFTFFILILSALMVGSAWGLGEQAWRTDHQRRWNVFALVAAYVAFIIVSVMHVWSRVFSVKKVLRSMPKPYMPTKNVDVPRRVSDLIQTEYSRTSVIAHLAQATTGQQEGWGRPGTKWADVHFRTYILSTTDEMRHILHPDYSHAPPSSLQPLIDATANFPPAEPDGKPDPLRLFVASYAKILERARYAAKEPTEGDAEAIHSVVGLVRGMVDLRTAKRDAAAARAAPSSAPSSAQPSREPSGSHPPQHRGRSRTLGVSFGGVELGGRPPLHQSSW